MMRLRRRWARGVVLSAAAAVALGGCATVAGGWTESGGQAGYVSGDDSVTTWEVAERSEPVRVAGTDYDGAAVDTLDWRGDVVVLNTWYAACPPCRAEAPDLVAFATDYADSPVHVLGINATDDAGAAKAFERTFAVPYPSLHDKDGSAIAALQGVVPVQAVPTTVLLDGQGRVAARILGRADPSTLRALVDELVAGLADEAA